MEGPFLLWMGSRETMMTMSKRRWVYPLLCLLLATNGAAGAQTQAESDAQPSGSEFFEIVDVSIANIDVWVTDKEGQPVSGLVKEDFVVVRDGKPVEVSNFYAVTGGRPASATGLPAAADDVSIEPAGEPVRRAPPQSRLAEEHRLWLVLFVDNYNLDPNERNRVFPALKAFLRENLRSGSQAMIVTYDRSLEVVQPFTDRFDRLEGALDEISQHSGLATIRRRERIETLQLIDRAADEGQALNYARNYAEDLMNGVEYTADSLESFLHSLGGLPGRKALVHVSSGIPMVAGEEAFHAVAEKFDSSSPYSLIPRYDTSRRFERVTRTANANRVVFYTADAGGLRGLEFGNAEYAGFVDMDLRSTLDSIVPENLQAPLRLIAIETGGTAIINQNELLRPLRKAARDFGSFYSLGLSSQNHEDGTYHQIKVKLAAPRRGVTVRHRSGYLTKSTDTRARESLEAALLYEHADNPAELEVRSGEIRPNDRATWLLPLQLRVPVSSVTLVPTTPGHHETRLRLYVGAVSADGEGSAIDVVPFGVRLADEHVEAAKKESLVHSHRLLLSPGPKKVGIAVLDLFGGGLSVVTTFVEVGSPQSP